MQGQELSVGHLFEVFRGLLGLREYNNLFVSVGLDISLYMLEHLLLSLDQDSFVDDALWHLVRVIAH